jgi:protein involved in polysaccharide export with SLBB domain
MNVFSCGVSQSLQRPVSGRSFFLGYGGRVRAATGVFVALFLHVFSVGSVQAAGAEFNERYRLGTGDVISIIVFGEEDLSFEEVRLTDLGTVPFPFLGEVRANGRTVAELEQLILESLKGDYLIDPRVTVRVTEYRQVYISGEVKKPGGYAYVPGLTVNKAVTLAGGLTDRASERKMYIIRDGESAEEPEKASMDSKLNPGDTLKIDESFF